jgi:hypothetical protein
MSGYKAYQLHKALKLHFTQEKFDAYKYHLKTRSNVTTYNKLNYRYAFEKLAERYKEPELIDFFVANFLVGNTFAMNMSEETHLMRQSRVQSLTYKTKEDIVLLKHEFPDFDSLCVCDSSGSNPLIELLISNDIQIETCAIIHRLTGFISDKFTKSLVDPLQFKKEKAILIKKYSSVPFINDINRFRHMIVETYREV